MIAISVILEIRLTCLCERGTFLPMKTDDAAARLEALGNPTRLQVYRALVRAGGAGMSVGKLQAKLDLPASTLSHHLKTLLSVGLVTQERQATTLICRANYDVMRGLVDFLVAECCADAACAPSQAKGKAA
jgi:ArsR family transcriptional regulator